MFADLPSLPKEPKSRGYRGMFADLPSAPEQQPMTVPPQHEETFRNLKYALGGPFTEAGKRQTEGIKPQEDKGRIWTDTELEEAGKLIQQFPKHFTTKEKSARHRAEAAAHPFKALPDQLKTIITAGIAKPFGWGELIAPGVLKELDEELMQIPGIVGPAAGASAAEAIDTTIKLKLIFPHLFKLAGIPLKTAPAKWTADILKKATGLNKLADLGPTGARIERLISTSFEAMTKGFEVGVAYTGVESYAKGLSLEEATPLILKNATLMAGMAGAFNMAGFVDTQLYRRGLKKALLRVNNAKFRKIHNDIQTKMPDYVTIGGKRLLNTAKGKAIKGAASDKNLELHRIDKIVAEAEATLIGAKKGKLIPGQRAYVESPTKAAQRFMAEPAGAQIMVRGAPQLQTGMGIQAQRDVLTGQAVRPGLGKPAVIPKPSPLEHVYMKGFIARLTSIRNNADNIIAGAGEKGSQLKVMKEELSKIENHYESIAKDIKENPELLAELGKIDKLLPNYSRAIDSFVDSPSKKGFEEIKAVGDKIAELSTTYGVRIGEQAPTAQEGKVKGARRINEIFPDVEIIHSPKTSLHPATFDAGKNSVTLFSNATPESVEHEIRHIAIWYLTKKGNFSAELNDAIDTDGVDLAESFMRKIEKMPDFAGVHPSIKRPEIMGSLLKGFLFDSTFDMKFPEVHKVFSKYVNAELQNVLAPPTVPEGKETFAEQVEGLEKLAEERGLKPEIAPEERRFKEPTITHHLTPQLHEAEKLGVRFMTKPAEVGKQRLDVEFNRHVRDLDKAERIINKLGGETIRSKAAAKLKNKPTKSIERFTQLLNTYEEAPANLSDKEKVVFNYFRNLSRSLIARENEARKKLGMEPIVYKPGYVRHIVDKLAEDMIDGRHPIPEDLKFWAEENVKAKIHNPMEFQRKLGDELEDIFSKDLIRLSKAMMWTGLREVHLTEPLKFFESQLALHSEVIPSTTRRWTEKFINHMIKGQPTDLDKSLDALVTKSGLNGIFNKILKPFGRHVSNRPLTNLMQKAGRLQIYGVMGWRPKQLIRNKFQLVQNLALYTVKANLKSFLPANKQLKGFMSESLFLETYRGFEDLTAIDKKTLGKWWLAPFQWTAVSNARQAMKCAYWDTLDLIENKKYKEFGWADPKRTYKEKPGFLYESEKAKILNEMEFGGSTTQYHYIPMAMPEVFRHKALIPFTRLQSWWMNHFFGLHDIAGRRFFTGEAGYEGGGRLPWSRRIGWGRYMVIGGIILNTLGYTRSYLLGAAPDSFPPIGKLLANMFIWMKAAWTGNKKTRESAERKMLNSIKTFMPGYLAIKDVKAVISGEKGPIHLFFYGKQKEQERGRKRKRPARKTRRRR